MYNQSREKIVEQIREPTTASCSFSSSMCSSEAVSGRGCRSGPGPASVDGSRTLPAAAVGCWAVIWGDSAVGVDEEVGLTVC